MHDFIQKFKIEIRLKDLALWFILSYVGVLIVNICVAKKALTSTLLLQTFGFAVVFVIMMIGTKSYNHFINDYYQSHIDRHNKKVKQKNSKKGIHKG